MLIFLCLCAQATVLKSVLSPYQNDWDEEMRFNSGFLKDKMITGLYSYHNNHHEDRRWRFYYGSASGVHCLRKNWTPHQNSFDGDLNFRCGSNEALSGVWSYHHNTHEDRRWKFQCCSVKGYPLFRERTKVINSWDGKMDFKCGDNEVLIGLKSHHDNRKEDRVWQARCAMLQTGTVVSGIFGGFRSTGYVNSFDRKFKYNLGSKYVMTGLYSYHDGRKEDRRFKIYYAKLRIQCSDSSWSGYINKWDGIMDFKCRANYAMNGLQSHHSNHREDRRYKVRCCNLSNGGKYKISSYKTVWVNNWDGKMNYRCPSNGVLVGLYSEHDNRKEDRRFKFYCGLLTTDHNSPNLIGFSRSSEVQRSSYFLNRKIDDIFIIMTHNSLALPGKVFSFNQNRGLARQFRDGVRGFNFDLYPNGSKIKSCHGGRLWCHNPEDDIKGLMNELRKGRYDDAFIIIQLESYISTSHYRLLEKWFGEKLVKNFDKEKKLGYYLERNQQVLIFTDKDPQPHQGIHDTNAFIVENDYKWWNWNRYGDPKVKYRRGPKSGTRMRIMNNFITLPDMVASSIVNGYDRALRNINTYRKQSYTGGKINGLLVDFYEKGNVFKIQKHIR